VAQWLGVWEVPGVAITSSMRIRRFELGGHACAAKTARCALSTTAARIAALRLVCQMKGTAASFRCPYHGWLYGIEGALRGVPSEKDFPHVDKARTDWTPVAWKFGTALSSSILAVQRDAGAVSRRLDAVLDGMPFQDYPFQIKIRGDIDSNWKFLVNASTRAITSEFFIKKRCILK